MIPGDSNAAPVAPRALPVTGDDPAPSTVAMNTTPPAIPASPPAETPPATTSASSKFPNGPHPTATTPPMEPTATPTAANADEDSSNKPLILTASQDSFVRVTLLDSTDTDKPVFASVLHSGESKAFSGHKFSINVGVPSAVDIKLDGVNYGPHSDGSTPETFTVQSHVQ
jgi:hypothetical protein